MWCSTMEGEDRRRDLAGASHAEVRAIAMMPGRRAGKRRKIGRAAMPSGIYACFRHGQRAAPIILEEGADDREPRRRWTDDTPCQRVVRNLAARRLRVCLRWRPTLVLCIIYVASRRFLHPVNRWNSTIGANPSPAPWGIMFPDPSPFMYCYFSRLSLYCGWVPNVPPSISTHGHAKRTRSLHRDPLRQAACNQALEPRFRRAWQTPHIATRVPVHRDQQGLGTDLSLRPIVTGNNER